MASNRMVNVMMAATTAMIQTRTCTLVTRMRARAPTAGLEGPSLWGVEKLTPRSLVSGDPAPAPAAHAADQRS
jgi:hypothetical protein